MQYKALSGYRSDIKSVVVVDDHPLYRDALVATTARSLPHCDIRVAGDMADLMAQLASGGQPDLVILDLILPDANGLSGFEALREAHPDCAILVVSAIATSETIDTLMRKGAAGYMPKDASAEEFSSLLQEIARGRSYQTRDILEMWRISQQAPCKGWAHPRLTALPPQQRRVLELICEGKANKQIAFELNLALATVKAHITAILRRLEVHNRTQAVVLVETLMKETARA